MEQEPLTIAVACPPSRHKFVDDVIDILRQTWGKDPTDSAKLMIGKCPALISWDRQHADLVIHVGTTGRIGQAFSDDQTRGFVINPHYLALSPDEHLNQVRSAAGHLRKKVLGIAKARRQSSLKPLRAQKVLV